MKSYTILNVSEFLITYETKTSETFGREKKIVDLQLPFVLTVKCYRCLVL